MPDSSEPVDDGSWEGILNLVAEIGLPSRATILGQNWLTVSTGNGGGELVFAGTKLQVYFNSAVEAGGSPWSRYVGSPDQRLGPAAKGGAATGLPLDPRMFVDAALAMARDAEWYLAQRDLIRRLHEDVSAVSSDFQGRAADAFAQVLNDLSLSFGNLHAQLVTNGPKSYELTLRESGKAALDFLVETWNSYGHWRGLAEHSPLGALTSVLKGLGSLRPADTGTEVGTNTRFGPVEAPETWRAIEEEAKSVWKQTLDVLDRSGGSALKALTAQYEATSQILVPITDPRPNATPTDKTPPEPPKSGPDQLLRLGSSGPEAGPAGPGPGGVPGAGSGGVPGAGSGGVPGPALVAPPALPSSGIAPPNGGQLDADADPAVLFRPSSVNTPGGGFSFVTANPSLGRPGEDTPRLFRLPLYVAGAAPTGDNGPPAPGFVLGGPGPRYAVAPPPGAGTDGGRPTDGSFAFDDDTDPFGLLAAAALSRGVIGAAPTAGGPAPAEPVLTPPPGGAAAPPPTPRPVSVVAGPGGGTPSFLVAPGTGSVGAGGPVPGSAPTLAGDGLPGPALHEPGTRPGGAGLPPSGHGGAGAGHDEEGDLYRTAWAPEDDASWGADGPAGDNGAVGRPEPPPQPANAQPPTPNSIRADTGDDDPPDGSVGRPPR